MKIPDRSVIVGGACGYLVTAAVAYLNSKGLEVPEAIQMLVLATLIPLVVQLVPDSAQNIIDKLNNNIVIKAMRDPNSAVSPVLPPQKLDPPAPGALHG